MFNLLTVGFEFNNNFYYSLIRVKPKTTGTDYEVTVMNGDLEKLLYGNHVIRQINNRLEIDVSESSEQGQLKSAVAEALSDFLKIPLERKHRVDGVMLPLEMPVAVRLDA